MGPFTEKDDEEGRLGPYRKAPYGEASYGKHFNYGKAYGKLRGGTLPESGGNFRVCAIDQKKAVSN